METPEIERADILIVAESEAASEQEDAGIAGLLSLLVPLVQRRRLLMIFTLVGLLAGGLWTLHKGSFLAMTTVLPPQSSITSSLFNQAGGIGGALGAGLGLRSGSQDLYVTLMQSPSVLKAMVRRYHLKEAYGANSDGEAQYLLSKRLTVDGSGRDGMIRLFIKDDSDPNRAATLANGFIEEFNNFMTRLAVGEAGQRRLFFEAQMKKEKDDLADAEEKLQKVVQKTGAVQLDAQTNLLVQSAANLRSQIAYKEVEIQSIRSFAGPDNINLERAEQELAALRAELARVSGSTTDENDPMAVTRNGVPETALENVRAQRTVRYHEGIMNILTNQYAAARMDEAREGSAVQVVEPASPSPARFDVPVWRKLVTATLLGLFTGIVVVLAQYTWQRMLANRAFAHQWENLHDAYSSKV